MPLNEIAKRLTHPGLLQKWVSQVLVSFVLISHLVFQKLMYYVPWRDVATAAVTSFEQYSVPNECSAWLTIKKSYLAAVMGNSWDHNYALEQDPVLTQYRTEVHLPAHAQDMSQQSETS